jgi:UDP-N-acetylmuramoylalanine--D-glutamate ligase
LKNRAVILGAGESGVGAAILAKKQGWDVFVSDFGTIKAAYKDTLIEYNIAFEEGKHTEDDILNANLIIKSPGISDKSPLILKLKQKAVSIVSELEFAARYTTSKKICITGTNGKTTATLLTYHVLKKAGYDVGCAGNVGKSFARMVAEEPHDYYVLEVSSFQLDDMHDFKADIAILLNITEDHLDRYDYTFQKYIDSKFRIVNNQTQEDTFIYCADDAIVTQMVEKLKPLSTHYPFSIKKELTQGAWLQQDKILFTINQNQTDMSIYELALQGKHNLYNSMAAGIAARVLEVRKDIIRESLSDFQNVEHRLEHVIDVCGVRYINDSKATNVNSTWYALESMDKSTVWIVGGVDKGNDYAMLKDLVKEKVKAIICLGTDNSKIIEAYKEVVPQIAEAKSMYQAVGLAYRFAKKGETVLLSPACASFDLFENYEDRGRQFKEAVRSL